MARAVVKHSEMDSSTLKRWADADKGCFISPRPTIRPEIFMLSLPVELQRDVVELPSQENEMLEFAIQQMQEALEKFTSEKDTHT
eukprot:4292451-Amphidinium_carterae.2